MDILQLDYETRSECPINQEGAYKYATHPSTSIYCLGWAFNDEPVAVWLPGVRVPQRIIDHIKAGGIITAWNATFERLITWYVLCPDYDIPEPALEQFRCTAAKARGSAMPSALADAARCLDLPIQKLPEGKRLIKEYCAQNVPWQDIPTDDQVLMIQYCRVDVETERMVGQCVRELTDHEWEEYHINETINDRGIPVDVDMAKHALCYAEEVRAEVDQKIAILTEYEVTTSRQRKTRDEWIFPQLNEDMMLAIVKKPEHVDEDTGETVAATYSFDEEHRKALRVVPGLPEPVHEYLDLLDEAGGATIAKYAAMVNMEIDDRINGTIMFNGAGQTGRFSSLKLQAHNLRRDSFDDPEPIIADLVGGVELDDVTTTLARLVRSAIYNPNGLSWFDYSAIEGRVAPWLEGGRRGEAKLDLYRQGVDPYVYNASRTFGIEMEAVDKSQRQAGKLQELALQFLGGQGALKLMGRNYGLHIEDDEAQQMVDGWRLANPWAKTFGAVLESAALRAVMHPGDWFEAGRVKFICDGSDWLWMQLPSGRFLSYAQPRTEMVETPWGDEVLSVTATWGSSKPKKGEAWPRRQYHGGLWIENCIAGGTEVLTDSGWVRIEDVHPWHRIHDGVEFVTHSGLLYKSEQSCVSVDGVYMTPDHEVLTDDGWRTASTQPRLYRPNLRDIDGVAPSTFRREETVVDVRLPLWRGSVTGAWGVCEGGTQGLHTQLRVPEIGGERLRYPRHERPPCLLGLAQYAGSLSATFTSSLAQLRRAWDSCVCGMGQVVHSFLGGYGRYIPAGAYVGPHQQRRGLHTGELPVGYHESAGTKHPGQSADSHPLGGDDDKRSGRAVGDQRDHDTVPTQGGLAGPRRSDHHTRFHKPQPVYDILNCGPRQRFVVRGDVGPFIVHNCTQAAAADLLRGAIVRADDAGLDVVLHVHDEIVVEGYHAALLGKIMLDVEPWAEGLPLAGEGGMGKRYGK